MLKYKLNIYNVNIFPNFNLHVFPNKDWWYNYRSKMSLLSAKVTWWYLKFQKNTKKNVTKCDLERSGEIEQHEEIQCVCFMPITSIRIKMLITRRCDLACLNKNDRPLNQYDCCWLMLDDVYKITVEKRGKDIFVCNVMWEWPYLHV